MTPDLEQAKRSMRDARRRALAAVPSTQSQAWSDAIVRNILRSDLYGSARTVMAFLAIRGEPDLAALCRAALKAGKVLCLPRVDWGAGPGGGMSAVRVRDIDSGLVVERMGVREPAAGGEVVPSADLDLILVPGLAFDEHGRRLGRGGGHYDRFLAGLSSARAGVAFEVQLAPEVPAGPGDECVDAVVTERRIIQTGAGRGPG